MLKLKTYHCGICQTEPDQISHHKSHLETQKHKDKKELFELKLSQKNPADLLAEYETESIPDIVKKIETIIVYKNKQTMSETEMIQAIQRRNNLTTNKEALRDLIHNIHNYMRNNGVGYGMNGLKVFNLFYALKKIEEYGLFEKTGLSNQCRFSYLLKLANESKNNLLAATIYNDVLDSIHSTTQSNRAIYFMLFYEIPKNLKANIYSYLIKEIEKISKTEQELQVQLCGKIYEYFIGRDRTAISELGAYFTDRPITNYCFQKVNPSLNEDGSLPTMIDMFGGSGGFTVGFIGFMKEKYPQIDWKRDISKVHHYDMNEDVIKCACLEFFCITGELPMVEHLKSKNSFKDEFNDEKFQYIFTNPPYGGDSNDKGDIQLKREKVKEYVKNDIKTLEPVKPKNRSIKSQQNKDDDENDVENNVEEDNVIEPTIIITKKKKTNRKIILKPSDELQNTTEISTETAEILKRRKEQLKQIEQEEKREKRENEEKKVCIQSSSERVFKFSEKYKLKANDKEAVSLIMIMEMLAEGGTTCGVLKEGVFFDKKYTDLRKCLIENFNVREIVSIPQNQFENTATKTSILIFDNLPDKKTTEVSFRELKLDKVEKDVFEEIDGKIYLTENAGEIKGDAYDELVSTATIGDLRKNPLWSLNGKDYGKKEVVVGEDFKLVKLGDICEFQNQSKRLASFGNENGLYNFYSSSDKIKKCDIADYNLNEAIIIGNGGNSCIHYTNTPFSCSSHSFVMLSNLNNKYVYYCLLSLWEAFIGNMNGSVIKNISKNTILDFQIPIPKSEEKMREWVDKISRPYNEKNEKQAKIKSLEAFVENRIREMTENQECEEVELGSICEEIFCGKNLTKNKSIDGEYNVYGGGETSYTHNKYNLEGFHIVISRVGNNNISLLNEKFYLTDNGFSILIKELSIKKFIGYYLLLNKSKIVNISNGSAQKVISKTALKNIKIKLPKNKQLIQELEPTFEEIERLQTETKNAETLYQQYIKELRDVSIVS
jgi:restriction endonuclease S subunit